MIKKTPPPQAGHLDNPQGGEGEAQLLEARIKTLKELGMDAMSPMDIKNGYSPHSIIKLLEGQIAFMRDQSPNILAMKEKIKKDQQAEIKRIARDKAKREAKNLEVVGRVIDITLDHIGGASQTQNKGTHMEQEQEKTGAEKLFEQTSEIRRAVATLKAEKRETNKRYKKAVATLEQALEGIYVNFEDKQMMLFAEEPELSEDVTQLLDHPSLM